MRQLSVAMAVALLVACPGPRMPAADAGADVTEGMVEPRAMPPSAPRPPLPPQRACPGGFRAVERDGRVVDCDPGHPTCGPGELSIPGEGCQPVSRACPSSGWPDDLPASTAYVRSGASAGDGSRARPYGSLSEALASAASTVALAPGRYPIAAELTRPVHLVGACAEGTIFEPTSTGTVLLVASADTHIEHITFELAGQATALRNRNGSHSRVANSIVRDAREFGLIAVSGGLEVDHVLVEGTRLGTMPQSWGVVAAGDTTSLSIERATFRDNETIAIGVQEGARLTVARTRVEGRGLLVRAGGEADVRESAWVPGPGLEALVVHRSMATLRDSWLGRSGTSDLVTGIGAEAHVTVSNCTLIEAANAFRLLSGAALEALDSRIEDARLLTMESGHSVHLERVSAHRFRSFALSSDEEPTAPTPGSVVLRDVALDGEHGLTAQGVALAVPSVLERVRLEGVELPLTFWRGRHRVTDVAVASARLAEGSLLESRAAFGTYVLEDAMVEVERLAVEGTTGVGIVALGELRGSDLGIRMTDRDPRATFAGGLVALGSVDLARVAIAHSVGFGVYASGLADLSLSDLQVTASRRESELVPGSALAVFGGRTRVRSFELVDGDLCGAHVAQDGTLELSDGRIEGFTIGACVQREGVDPTTLTTSVVFRDNGTSLQTVELPIPAFDLPLP